MTNNPVPCGNCEQGLSSCCRLVYAQDIEALLPDECWTLKVEADILSCSELIGGKFLNDTEWTEEMCCLPCRIRLVIERTAMMP